MAFAFRSKAKSQSSSLHSRIEPACTKPAQLNSTSIGPTLGGQRLDRGVVEHVELARFDRLAGESVDTDVGRNHARAFAGEEFGGGEADALSRCGNQGRLAGQSLCHLRLQLNGLLLR